MYGNCTGWTYEMQRFEQIKDKKISYVDKQHTGVDKRRWMKGNWQKAISGPKAFQPLRLFYISFIILYMACYLYFISVKLNKVLMNKKPKYSHCLVKGTKSIFTYYFSYPPMNN